MGKRYKSNKIWYVSVINLFKLNTIFKFQFVSSSFRNCWYLWFVGITTVCGLFDGSDKIISRFCTKQTSHNSGAFIDYNIENICHFYPLHKQCMPLHCSEAVRTSNIVYMLDYFEYFKNGQTNGMGRQTVRLNSK